MNIFIVNICVLPLLPPQVTEDLATTEAFQFVRTGNYVVCELCKRSGKSLRTSLKGVKRSPSTHHQVLSNAIKHLKGNGSHTKIMEEDSKKVEAALQAKRKLDGVNVSLLVVQYSFSFRSCLN